MIDMSMTSNHISALTMKTKTILTKILLAFFVAIAVAPIAAQTKVGAFDPTATGIAQGDKLYMEQKYEDAITVYEEVMQVNGVSSELLYNLGNACFKANQLGKAVLCYERALRLDPGNKNAQNNLAYVRTRIDDLNKGELKGRNLNITPDAPSFLGGIYSGITKETSSNYWALFAAFAFVLFIGFLALYIFTGNVAARKCGFFGGILFFVFSVVFLLFAFAASREYYSKDEGIVTAYKVELRTDPADEAKVSTTPLNCGTKLSVLDTQNDVKGNPLWYKVRLNSEFLGWIKAQDFEII